MVENPIIYTLDRSYLHTFWNVCVNGIFDQLPIGKIKYYNIIHSIRNSLWQSFFSVDLKKICLAGSLDSTYIPILEELVLFYTFMAKDFHSNEILQPLNFSPILFKKEI